MSDQKLCINCAHARRTGISSDCWHPNNVYLSPVDGREKARLDCSFLRDQDGAKYCGPDGRWFQDNGAFGDIQSMRPRRIP